MATCRVGYRRSAEFEPQCKWEKDECSEIVELDLQGFKKEQIKITINHCAGILCIIGERPLEKTITSRFRKEIKLPDNIKTNEIRAKFCYGVLTITMPKKPRMVSELISQDCGKLVLADYERPESLMDLGVNMVAIKSDERCALKCMALGGIAAVGTLLVLAGAFCCGKYY